MATYNAKIHRVCRQVPPKDDSNGPLWLSLLLALALALFAFLKAIEVTEQAGALKERRQIEADPRYIQAPEAPRRDLVNGE